jgi:protein involved in ribonucleotide reduction
MPRVGFETLMAVHATSLKEVIDKVARQLGCRDGRGSGVMVWNDTFATTGKEVAALLRAD